jgi:hypothetical protein
MPIKHLKGEMPSMIKTSSRIIASVLSISLVVPLNAPRAWADPSFSADKPAGISRATDFSAQALAPVAESSITPIASEPKIAVSQQFGYEVVASISENPAPDERTAQLAAESAKAVSFYGLTNEDGVYLRQMGGQYLRPDDPNQQLSLVSSEHPDGNFVLADQMSSTDRQLKLKEIERSQILSDPQNLAEARHIVFTFNLLHGGIGENVGRKIWLAHFLGIPEDQVVLGAKGTDLGVWVENFKGTGKKVFIKDAELQMLACIEMMRQTPPVLGGLIFQPIVNKESERSFVDLFDMPYIEDRVRGDIEHPRTNREVLREMGIAVSLHMQNMLPGLEVASEFVEDSAGRRRNTDIHIVSVDGVYQQGGGHGQVGVFFIMNAKNAPQPNDGMGHFRVFGNGDNANANLFPEIAGYLRRASRSGEGFAVVQVNTPATMADRKVGKVGTRKLRLPDKMGWKREAWVPDMMELGQAKAADRADQTGTAQETTFVNIGQQLGGNQPVNLNSYVMDQDKLHELLQDLWSLVGEDEFIRITAPTLVPKPPKKGKNGKLYVPIDGTIGSVMHNINAWFLIDPRGPDLLRKHGLVSFLGYVNTDRGPFAPVKFVLDKYLQMQTDAYSVDTGHWRLSAMPGYLFPEIEMDNSYASELQSMIDAYGRMRLHGLTSLHIKGAVQMRDPELSGVVEITSESPEVVNLRSDRYKEQLESAGILDGDRLVLKNVKLHFDVNGDLTITPISPPSKGSGTPSRGIVLSFFSWVWAKVTSGLGAIGKIIESEVVVHDDGASQAAPAVLEAA